MTPASPATVPAPDRLDARRRVPAIIFAAAMLIAAGESSPVVKPLFVPGLAAPDFSLPARTLSSRDYVAFIPVLPRDQATLAVRVDALLSGENGALVPVAVTRKTSVSETAVTAAPLVIAAGDDLRLQLRAALPAPGNYDMFIRLRTLQGSSIATIGGKVTWLTTALPSDGIVADPPVTLFSGTGAKIVDVTLAGIAEHDLGFTISPVTLFRTTAAGKIGIGGAAVSSGCPRNSASHTVLTRSSATLLKVRFCNLDSAGEYHAQFDLIGDGGGLRHVDVQIKNRLSWAYFLLAVVAGGAIGAPLAWWRTAGREQADTLLKLTNLLSSIEDMAKPLGTRGSRLQPLIDQISQAKRDIAAQGKYDQGAAFIADFSARRDLLTRVLWQCAQARHSHAALIELAVDAALGAIAQGPLAEATSAVEALALAVKTATQAAVKAAITRTTGDASPPIDPPFIPLFTGRESYRVLLRKRTWLDLGSTLVLFVLFAIVAFQVLWIPNAVWGSFSDFAIALTTGLAAFGGLATQLGTFKSAVQVPGG